MSQYEYGLKTILQGVKDFNEYQKKIDKGEIKGKDIVKNIKFVLALMKDLEDCLDECQEEECEKITVEDEIYLNFIGMPVK